MTFIKILLQHQKNQMIAISSRGVAGGGREEESEGEAEAEAEEGDYTVYECPGLASVGSHSVLGSF